MKKNEVKVFENEELGLQVRTILNPDGSISINAEDAAFGFGWITVAKSGNEVVRWSRMNGYCKELGFSPEVGKDDYIPESLYYLLGMKANNEKAQKYQRWLAMDVLPALRKTGSYEIPKQKEKSPKRPNLSSANMMVKNIKDTLKEAGVEPIFIAAEVKRLYTDLGYPVTAPLVTDKETMPKLYDCTEMAKELGIYSTTGNPHNQAVSAIIKKLHIPESEIITTAFSRNGHDDVTIQYKPSVLEDVKLWLAENNYPMKIPYVDSKGNAKTCTVVYREVA